MDAPPVFFESLLAEWPACFTSNPKAARRGSASLWSGVPQIGRGSGPLPLLGLMLECICLSPGFKHDPDNVGLFAEFQ